MVITYIQPTDEVLEPPIEKEQSDISHKYVVYNNKLFQLVDNQADGLCLFYGVISFLKDQNISLGNDSLSVSVCNIRDKETFLESGIVASLLNYLSKLNEADFGELIQYADFSGEKVDIDTLPPEYHEDIKKIVKNFSDEEIKVQSLNWIATFISKMINATPDPNCSWPGDVHALILSKLIQTNIVMVDNLSKGLISSFDTSGYIEMFNSEILSAAAQIGRKNCYLFRYNSDYSNFHCHWNEYKNHFVYMKEILDKTESDDEWKNAYTGRGGIPDDRCNPFTPDASVSLSDQEGSEQNNSLDDVKSSESNAEMQVDNTTPATITSEVTCCAAGDLCTAPMGTKISFLKC